MMIDGLEVCDAKLALYIVDKYDLYQINDVEITSQILDVLLGQTPGANGMTVVELMRIGSDRTRQAAGVPSKGAPEWAEFWRS